MKILVADDNLVQRMVLEFYLKRSNHQVISASNGQEALQLLETHPDIRLGIIDIRMPDMDGLELLSRMKSSPALRDLPFILCSAVSNVEHLQKAAQLGCRFFVLKPVQEQVFMKRVQEALESVKMVSK